MGICPLNRHSLHVCSVPQEYDAAFGSARSREGVRHQEDHRQAADTAAAHADAAAGEANTPQPQQQPQSQPQPKLKVQPPKTTSNNSSTTSTESKYVAPKQGSESGVPSGQGSAAPAPAAPSAPPGTPKPACRTPYQDATAVQAVTPDYPDQAREQGLGEVQVTVIVTISPSGSLVNATIGQGSGNMSIDQAALSAARQSTYAPKIVNCQPVEGTYNFKVTFDPNS